MSKLGDVFVDTSTVYFEKNKSFIAAINLLPHFTSKTFSYDNFTGRKLCDALTAAV